MPDRQPQTVTAHLYGAGRHRRVLIPAPAPSELLVNHDTYVRIAGPDDNPAYVEKDQP